MVQDRNFPKATVSPRAERTVRAGHPWVYETEVLGVEEGWEDGELVDLVSQKGRYLGTGFINSHSKIRLRVISQNANDRFDRDFFARRLGYAVDYRRAVMGEDFHQGCRLIFGEADQFPGLTVDRFGDLLVTQTLSLGMEKRKGMLFPLLAEILADRGAPVKAIYERNDVAIRTLEGMEEGTGFFPLPGFDPAQFPETVEITENGLRFLVDYRQGQKTGFFLDQKENRKAVARLSSGRTVLDCCTHTGAFALNAALGGACRTLGIDVSQSALEAARENARRNGLQDRVDFEEANVFDYLTALVQEKRSPFDFIILDPPAFTKSHHTVRGASRGYKEINLKAMKALPRGGLLATCSCSHFMTEELFREMLTAAAQDAGVSLRQIEARQQAPDHPILWNVPETNYLKFYLFQVV